MTTAFQNNAFQLDAFQIEVVSGVISANDSPDTASLAGSVTASTEVYGSISATDQNDIALLLGTVTAVPSNVDTHDGFTKEEIKRARELDKRLRKAREKLEEAKKQQKIARKQNLRDLVDPKPKEIVAKTQQADIKSIQDAKENSLAQVIKASALVKRLELQQRELERAILLKQEQARIEAELAILRAKEIDDEESILALLM
jgi:hypothetical protein